MVLSCLIERPTSIVLDASVAINLNATKVAENIIQALPNTFYVTDVVLDELQDDLRSGRSDGLRFRELIRKGLIYESKLDAIAEVEFERLVVGSNVDTLDDGEAATIAAAHSTGQIAILDERKGRRICRERYPDVIFGSTCDILSHPNVERDLGRRALRAAVAAALGEARMSVTIEHRQWALELLEESAEEFSSLKRAVRARSRP